MKSTYFENLKMDKNRLKSLHFTLSNCELRNSFNSSIRSIKLFLITILMIPMFWSCEFLNYTESDQYSVDQIFEYMSRAKWVLNHTYSYLPTDFNSIDGAMRSSASDDAVHVWDISAIQKFNDGSWSPTSTVDAQWGHYYSGIRSANLFLKEGDGLTFPDIKWNIGYEDAMQQYVIYSYEARFLRAFYHFELAKRYGRVPLITNVLTLEEVNNVSPSSFDELVNFIVAECDAIIPHLRVSYSGFVGNETGRATRGAAMALKARTLLYAASPLHNSNNEISRWVAAASAAKDLIDQLATTYTPLPAYTATFNNLSSKELIFERRVANSRTFEEANTAIGFIGGNTGTCPTQNLVDAYEMKITGLGINEPGSGYDPDNPYAGRDPRFAMTILHNGSTWKSLPVEVWNGGQNGPPKNNATKTGYYLRKYMVESISLNPANPSTALHVWVIFRYSEVLLNYAEAMNEAYGPDGLGPGSLSMTAREAVNIVRARTGVAMPAFADGMSQTEFRTKLRNERRIELAFEDHRFWDLRRWKIGNTTTIIRGVDITNNQGIMNYTPKVVETRVWNDKMNLYPIPQNELFINKKLVQNQGW
jgi:starch-binding outer membrane protein, SusD/RagB family